MRKTILILLCIFFSHLLDAQVGVNILTTHTSAALQIASPPGVARGLLTPSMSPLGRITISSGTNIAADGLIVYDVSHKMHYYYHGGISKWASMSPFLLTTPSNSSIGVPSGAITTPSSLAVFSVGINTQYPSKELDVQGNAAVSGNMSIAGTATVNGSFSKTGFPVNPFVPAGTIVMWHGSTIPTGWAECNGSNGTPDLRGRFIVAAGQATATPVTGDLNHAYVANTTGGENRHTLTVAELPRHHHQASGDGATMTAGGGSHNHSVWANGQGGPETRAGGNAGGLAATSGANLATTSNTHSHANADFSGRVGDGSANGLNNSPNENRPQYYVLRFIMKLN